MHPKLLWGHRLWECTGEADADADHSAQGSKWAELGVAMARPELGEIEAGLGEIEAGPERVRCAP